jgi:hypothetical protein
MCYYIYNKYFFKKKKVWTLTTRARMSIFLAFKLFLSAKNP